MIVACVNLSSLLSLRLLQVVVLYYYCSCCRFVIDSLKKLLTPLTVVAVLLVLLVLAAAAAAAAPAAAAAGGGVVVVVVAVVSFNLFIVSCWQTDVMRISITAMTNDRLSLFLLLTRCRCRRWSFLLDFQQLFSSSFGGFVAEVTVSGARLLPVLVLCAGEAVLQLSLRSLL